MKNYSTVLFDLDGTLFDSGEGVKNSVVYALDKFGIKVEDRDALGCFIGPPLTVSFKTFYGFDEENADRGVAFYREYYKEKGIFEGYVYDGIEECLKRLKDSGKKIVVATSKPEVFAKKILRLFDIEKYFDFVGGATLDHTRVEKSAVLSYALDSVGADRDSSILVGDRVYDAEGARACGIDSLGVLYGHGSREEILSSGFTYTAENPREIVEILA